MTAIDMQLLKDLRNATFAPMKDCKEALVEANGDLEAAKEVLRKKWISKAGKKAERETNEWAVKVVNKNGKVIAVKLLCETDFVAKNDAFAELLDTVIEEVSTWNDVSNKDELSSDVLSSVEDIVASFVGKIWENVQLWDVFVSSDNAYVYNHPGNKVAAIVFFEWDEESAKEVALQVAAMDPTYLSFDEISQEEIERVSKEFKEELLKEGKPADMVDQIVKWKINKAFADDILLEQAYIRDWSKKVKEILADGFEVKSYMRFSIW